MSWDIVLFHSKERITSVEDLDETQLVPTDFSAALSAHFGQVIEDGSAREVQGQDYTIVYYETDEMAGNAIVNIYGEPALFELVMLARKCNWQLFDTGSGEMIDLEQPERNGYLDFERYRREVLRGKGEAPE